MPVSVSAFDARRIEELQAEDITGLQNAVPNLYLDRGDGANTVIFIRGIGQNDSLAFADAGVGVYVDDVFIARSQAAFLDLFEEFVKQSWGTAYQANVRRLIMLGGPNNGIDLSFRHGWTFSLTVYPECGGVINGPTPHDWLVCFGVWRNRPQWTYSSSYFPGSAQMLKRWDSVYGLPATEQDWYTTYYGGWGFYTHGNGITAYLGASLVDTVRNAGTNAGVRSTISAAISRTSPCCTTSTLARRTASYSSRAATTPPASPIMAARRSWRSTISNSVGIPRRSIRSRAGSTHRSSIRRQAILPA